MRAVTFNAWVGQDKHHSPGDRHSLYANVMRLLEETEEPEVVSLQEVWGWGERVPGYTRVQAPRDRFPHREARSTQLLVRKRGTRLLGKGAREAGGTWWTGPKHGLHHPPRVFPRAAFLDEEEDVAWDVIGLHRTRPPWSPGGRAYAAEHATLVDWAHDRPKGPVLLLGDHNGEEAAADLAKAVGGLYRLRGVDGFVVRGAAVAGHHRVPGEFGGDGHRPVLGRFVARP